MSDDTVTGTFIVLRLPNTVQEITTSEMYAKGVERNLRHIKGIRAEKDINRAFEHCAEEMAYWRIRARIAEEKNDG